MLTDWFRPNTLLVFRRTIDLTKQMIDNPSYKNERPEYIVLTGGAFQMPMVEAALRRHLPEYADRIKTHNSEMAIACGAVRYGTCKLDPVDYLTPSRTPTQKNRLIKWFKKWR